MIVLNRQVYLNLRGYVPLHPMGRMTGLREDMEVIGRALRPGKLRELHGSYHVFWILKNVWTSESPPSFSPPSLLSSAHTH
jgi:hypothetical protein